jgi:ankyrin repeat protein
MSLIDYVWVNNMDQVNRLILAGIDVNVTDSFKRTALWYAARFGSFECVETLLLAKADVNKDDGFLRITPVSVASSYGHSQCVQVLLKNKANVNLIDDYLRTPLHLAVIDGHVTCVRILIEAKAIVDEMDLQEHTPLAKAIRNDQHYCVEHLLYSGAKLRNVHSNVKPTPAIQQIIQKRRRVMRSTFILKGLLGKRIRIDGAEAAFLKGRLPKDIVNLVIQHVWSTRLSPEWIGPNQDDLKRIKRNPSF